MGEAEVRKAVIYRERLERFRENGWRRGKECSDLERYTMRRGGKEDISQWYREKYDGRMGEE